MSGQPQGIPEGRPPGIGNDQAREDSPKDPVITVVGLGPGDPSLLTVGAHDALMSANKLWVRTTRHPTLEQLELSIQPQSFDHLYNSLPTGEEVYRSIAESLLAEAKAAAGEGVVYAVPGSPGAGERSVVLLREFAQPAGVTVQVLPGVSALEAALVELGVDALAAGLQAVDASELAHLLDSRPSVISQFLNPTLPVVVTGVWQHTVASAVKLFLMANYPADWKVLLVRAGLGEAPTEVQLADLDRSVRVDHLTTLYVPPLPVDSPGASFYELTHIIARLRGPGGCPWDREQTHASLRRYLLEECYEALEALDNDDPAALEEELGDVLIQVSLHSEVAYSESEFDIGDVIRTLTSKLVRRHPHVFGEGVAENAAQVVANWQQIKKKERAGKGEEEGSALDGAPVALPALARAQSISQRAARSGFDWRDSEEVWRKVREELAEIEEVASDVEAGSSESAGTASPAGAALEEEFGDLLFVLVNWARFNGIQAEEALRMATLKFERRFRQLERTVHAGGNQVRSLTAEELDTIWSEVKRAERTGKAPRREVTVDPIP